MKYIRYYHDINYYPRKDRYGFMKHEFQFYIYKTKCICIKCMFMCDTNGEIKCISYSLRSL